MNEWMTCVQKKEKKNRRLVEGKVVVVKGQEPGDLGSAFMMATLMASHDGV